MGKHGLTIDNVLAFELVTADGQIRAASADEHPELFWALRGGGGNFGVVTSITYRLHPLGQVLAGRVVFPLGRARAALHALSAVDAAAPDELTTFALFATLPEVGPALAVHAVYSGDDLAAGEALLAPLRRAPGAVADTFRPMAYADLYPLDGPPPPSGRHFSGATTSLPALTPGAIEALLVAAESRLTPFSTIAMQRLHGAAARVDIEETAFGLRWPQYFVSLTAAWERGPGQPHQEWARGAEELLKPYASPGRYINFMGRGTPREIRAAYGPNAFRLAQIKAQYDPANLFRLNQNIAPEA
jgi:FAD/FMN-containing dehydrogenase